MGFKAEIEKAIHAVVPEATIELSMNPDGSYVGHVVAPEFAKLTHLERQLRVWKSLRERLQETASKIGILLMYSPAEFDAVLEEVA